MALLCHTDDMNAVQCVGVLDQCVEEVLVFHVLLEEAVAVHEFVPQVVEAAVGNIYICVIDAHGDFVGLTDQTFVSTVTDISDEDSDLVILELFDAEDDISNTGVFVGNGLHSFVLLFPKHTFTDLYNPALTYAGRVGGF